MKPETEEWVSAAEDDFEQARRAAVPPAVPKGVCYHAQRCTDLQPALSSFEADLRTIGPYAITARYPGMSVSDNLESAVERSTRTMNAVRIVVRTGFGLG
jgi:hypothetical protein